jgi:hypothetical protein
MRARTLAACLAVLLGAASLPFAEVEVETGDLTWTFSGQARFRPEWRSDLDLNEEANDDTFGGFMRIRLGVGAAYKENLDVFLQVQDSRVAGEEATTASNEENLDLHQGWVRLNNLGSDRLSLTLGRQEWIYGEQRLIGAFGWNNVGRAFDGAKARWQGETFWIDGLLARVSSSNAADPNDPNGVIAAVEGSDLYGIQSQCSPRKGREYGVYWMGFNNNKPGLREVQDPDPNAPARFEDTTINAFGGRMKDSYGRVDLNVEVVTQTGEVNGDDLSAYAGAVQVGVSFGEETVWRSFAGYDMATGDEDPTDGEREEFFNFFPTNHGHYGYADMEGWRNIKSPYAGVSMKTGRHFAQAKVHKFTLHEEAGPWKSAGGVVLGADPSGMSGDDVGTEVDLTYRFAYRKNTRLEAGLSQFDPGRFARLTRGEDTMYWGYVMLTAGF